MRRIRMVGLGIGAALAVSLVLATGASAALPELGRCVKQKHGEYTTGSCTTKAAKKGAGFFEWEPGAVANGFSIKGGLTTFEAEVSGTKFACKASSGAGEYVGSQKRFSQALHARGFEPKRDSKGGRGFIGVGLNAGSHDPYRGG